MCWHPRTPHLLVVGTVNQLAESTLENGKAIMHPDVAGIVKVHKDPLTDKDRLGFAHCAATAEHGGLCSPMSRYYHPSMLELITEAEA